LAGRGAHPEGSAAGGRPGGGDPGRLPDDLDFRTAAAPGVDEDELFIALMCGSALGAVWGDGRPWPAYGPDPPWSQDRERRRRHERLLERWEPLEAEEPRTE
jgi:hypothetical protein